MFKVTLFTIVGLFAGNYFYQATLAPTPDYNIALERSLFQTIACISMFVGLQFLVPEETKEITNDKINDNQPPNNHS